MDNLGMELEEGYQKLVDEAINVAEQMLQSHDTFALLDLLDEFDIHIDEKHAEQLLSRCHSAVVDTIVKVVQEIKDGTLQFDNEPVKDNGNSRVGRGTPKEDEGEEFDREEYYNPLMEADIFHQTLVDIQSSPCPKCGCTETKTEYNTHNGEYCTYDRICKGCGYVILSHMD